MSLPLLRDVAVRYIVQDVTTGWPARPAGDGPVEWYGWDDPSADMGPLDLWYPIDEPAAPEVPEQFTAGMWSVTATGESGEIEVTVSSLPDADPAITAIEYRIDGGAWVAFDPALTGTGTRTIDGLTDDVEVDVNLRAVNPVGPADDPGSDTKAVTPTEVVAGQFSAEWLEGEPDPYGDLDHLKQNSDGTGDVTSDGDPVGYAE